MNALSMTKEKFGKLDVAVNCAGKFLKILKNFCLNKSLIAYLFIKELELLSKHTILTKIFHTNWKTSLKF
jgi:hypothetical protein